MLGSFNEGAYQGVIFLAGLRFYATGHIDGKRPNLFHRFRYITGV